MLSWVDCLSLCDLTADEVRAIAEHEHIPDIAAMELGNWLIVTPDGRKMIKRMILDDLELGIGDIVKLVTPFLLQMADLRFFDQHLELFERALAAGMRAGRTEDL